MFSNEAWGLVDEPLPQGCCHTMAIRIWTTPGTLIADVPNAAKIVALGFLERATRALRHQMLQTGNTGASPLLAE